jgi:hypothetical protein
MIHGSCLCGSIRYRISGKLGAASHCHCPMCRKAHGAAFGTYARVEYREFEWLAGADEVASYRSSEHVTRTFCRRCGATLQYIHDSAPASFALALGTLDDDPGVRPELHMYVAAKAPWYEIADRLPQHAASP